VYASQTSQRRFAPVFNVSPASTCVNSGACSVSPIFCLRQSAPGLRLTQRHFQFSASVQHQRHLHSASSHASLCVVSWATLRRFCASMIDLRKCSHLSHTLPFIAFTQQSSHSSLSHRSAIIDTISTLHPDAVQVRSHALYVEHHKYQTRIPLRCLNRQFTPYGPYSVCCICGHVAAAG
jgi:hypothetical protein